MFGNAQTGRFFLCTYCVIVPTPAKLGSDVTKDGPPTCDGEQMEVASGSPAAVSQQWAALELELQDLKSRYANMVGSVSDAFCVVEMIFDHGQRATDCRFVEINDRFSIHTGLKASLGKTIRDLMPSIAGAWIDIFARVDRKQQSVCFNRLFVELECRWFEGTAFPSGAMHPHRVSAFFRNVQAIWKTAENLDVLNVNLEKAAAENALIAEALYNERERAQVTLNSIGDAVICTNIRGDVTYLNLMAERITGWTRGEAIGRCLEEVFHIIEAKSRTPIPSLMALATVQNKVLDLPPSCILLRRDATELSIEDSAASIHDRNGKVTGAVMVFHEVSAARSLSVQLSHQATHDSLTDLPNRSLLNDRLAQAISAVHRHQTSVAILYIDLDRFKIVNDSLGHAIGVQLLQTVALRLTGCVRESDSVSRQGGDEFVILLVDIKGDSDATICADKVLQTLRLPCFVEGHELHVSASIGIAICPQDGIDGDALLRNADSAMYEAKERGRDNYQYYRSDLNTSSTARQGLERDLRQAVARGELQLHYQPIVNVRSRAISGVEALLRWRSRKHGLLQPASFMSMAEESGLVVQIGHWVLGHACRQAKIWQSAGLDRLRLSVNVSAVELRSKDFVAGVAKTLEETSFNARYLEIELTETSLMQDSTVTAVVLKSLKNLGVRLALDDFGTGYSSLSYIRRFPVDTLKIDRSFVNQLTTDEDDAIIVSAVINMGKSLHMRVVAEGVETRAQLTFLERQRCPEAQGYLFSPPVNVEGFAALLLRGGIGIAD